MREMNNEKKARRLLLRLGALALSGVLVWQVVSQPVSQMIGALAESDGPLSKIYGILSESVGEPTTADDYYELANISIGQGEYEKALTELETARSLIPVPEAAEQPETGADGGEQKQTLVGVVESNQKQTEVGDSEAETEPILDENQLFMAELWLKTASVNILMGNVEAAQTALESCLAINTDEAQALLLRAQLAVNDGEYTSAMADLEKYLELTPADVNARLTLAQLQEGLGQYAAAIASYERLGELAPADESHQLNALRCRFLNGEYEAAIAGFDAYKERHAEDETDAFGGIADFLRAASLMQLSDYAAAVEGFEMAIAAGYDKASCLEQITMCSFETGDYNRVLSTGEELLAMENAAVAAPELVYQRMGISSMRLEDYEGALAYMDLAKEIAPQLEGNEYYRGVCLLSLGRDAEAVEAFSASIESNYLPQFCYYNRGVCYVELLEYEKAIEDMAMTLESGDDPDLIAAAKDILWQLASYFEQTAVPETTDAN